MVTYAESKKTTEKARLRFAHAETVIPFSCLLGLFLEGTGKLLWFSAHSLVFCCGHYLNSYWLWLSSLLIFLNVKVQIEQPNNKSIKCIADIKSIQSEEPLKAPPRPPHQRTWRGALVTPFAANTALVLHKCSTDNGAGMKYFVQALHNERPVIMPVSSYSLSITFFVNWKLLCLEVFLN